MKIGLINLPKDANYGGNLQRFALVKTLQKFGNDVFHYNLVGYSSLPWFKKPYSYGKRLIKKYILGQHLCIFQEDLRNKKLNHKMDIVSSFYKLEWLFLQLLQMVCLLHTSIFADMNSIGYSIYRH